MARWSLHGKVVLVTGGAGGLGHATAVALAARGAVPVLADLDAGALARAAGDGFATPPLTTTTDVTDRASCEAAVAAALDAHGRLDAVWANAGVNAFGPVEVVDPDAWRRVVDVNLHGAYETVRAALPAVIEARGYIALTCSVASFAHQPGVSAYAASKAGLEAFGNALRLEVAHHGVDVGTIHPGYVRTALVAEQEARDPAYRRLRAAIGGPFGRTVEVADVVPDIVAAFERRAARVVTPRTGWVVHALRPLLQTRAFTGGLRTAAPDIARLSRR